MMCYDKVWLGLFSIAIFFVHSCAREAIIGGDHPGLGQCGYQVSVQHNNRHFCGGGIIDKLYILSAANCYFDVNGRIYNRTTHVVTRTYDLNFQGVRTPVKTVFVAKEYQPNHGSRGDIAILELKRSLEINLSMTILKVPRQYAAQRYERAHIAGFGWQYLGGRNDARLRYAETVILSNDHPYCLHAHPHGRDQICAQIPQKDPRRLRAVCHGDEGGLLVHNDKYPVAVLSKTAFGCNETQYAAIYTSISYYAFSFIDFVLRQQYKTYKVKHIEQYARVLPINN